MYNVYLMCHIMSCIIRFASYENLMDFWRLIEPATKKMVRVTAKKEEPVLPRASVSIIIIISQNH